MGNNNSSLTTPPEIPEIPEIFKQSTTINIPTQIIKNFTIQTNFDNILTPVIDSINNFTLSALEAVKDHQELAKSGRKSVEDLTLSVNETNSIISQSVSEVLSDLGVWLTIMCLILSVLMILKVVRIVRKMKCGAEGEIEGVEGLKKGKNSYTVNIENC